MIVLMWLTIAALVIYAFLYLRHGMVKKSH